MTPKEKFKPLSGEWQKVLASPLFDAACDAAMLTLANEVPHTKTPGMPIDAIASVHQDGQLTGARRLLEILRTLHVPEEAPQPRPLRKLNYEAGV